jgi:hypothetical protein
MIFYTSLAQIRSKRKKHHPFGKCFYLSGNVYLRLNDVKTNEGLKLPTTRRAMDKSTPSLCSAAAFSVYNSLEQAQIRVNEKSTVLADSAFIRVGDEGFEPPTPCL